MMSPEFGRRFLTKWVFMSETKSNRIEIITLVVLIISSIGIPLYLDNSINKKIETFSKKTQTTIDVMQILSDTQPNIITKLKTKSSSTEDFFIEVRMENIGKYPVRLEEFKLLLSEQATKINLTQDDFIVSSRMPMVGLISPNQTVISTMKIIPKKKINIEIKDAFYALSFKFKTHEQIIDAEEKLLEGIVSKETINQLSYKIFIEG